MIERARHLATIRSLLVDVPCVAILGARQVGKTTLANAIAHTWDGPTHRFDLERAADLARLTEAELALEPLSGLIVIDEIQRAPDLFAALRVFIDRHPDRRMLILGSAAPELLRQSAETLAGRIAYHDLTPLRLDETGPDAADTLWRRGGFPRSYLANSEPTSFRWRLDFVRTFVEQDLARLAGGIPAATMDRFWRMLAHTHGQIWNSSTIARSFGVADTTVRRYVDALTATLVVRQLRPWHENVAKRQVRAPKVYVADSGLLHALLDLPDRTALERHPVVGTSWEGFIIDQIVAATGARADQTYFWATHSGAELDLLVVRGDTRVGFEIKRTTSPKITRSLRSAIETLHLDHAHVIHAGDATYPLGESVTATAASEVTTLA